MEKINYAQLYTKLTKGLSPKTKDIFDRRFGVKTTAKGRAPKGQIISIETLESIGDGLGITRERVRQIEEAGFTHVRKNHKDALEKIYAQFEEYFNQKGGFKKEEAVLEDLGGKNQKSYILFFLTIGGDRFSRTVGKKDYHYFWSLGKDFEHKVKDTLQSLVADISKHGQLVTRPDFSASFASNYNLHDEAVTSYLEISKKIQENKEGKLGLTDWPEINPRGVKDKAFLVFKRENKPLHFREITSLIDTLDVSQGEKKTHAQTVHNELIKDARFVLVGRGTYALGEWGYVAGTIKDIIAKTLKEKPHLVSQDEIVKEVLGQRLVARNTVMINLNNKKYFDKGVDGKYLVRESA